MQRIGILGGTFDPIHYGHLVIAEEARWGLHLDRVYFVPAAEQPFKSGHHCASAQQRLEMVRLACHGNPAFIPSDVELQRQPPSFTVDTLRTFHSMVASAQLWFILGGDALNSLPQWRAAHEIIRLARLAAVGRPGVAPDLSRLDAALPGLASRTDPLIGPLLDISSTALRQRIAAGQPVRYQMPDAVLEYIVAQQLYQE